MSADRTRQRVVAGVALWLALAPTPIGHLLQSTMTLQLLVQVPLLILAGWLMAHGIPGRIAAGLAAWDRSGVGGLLLASLVSLVWMLPRMMDSSVTDPRAAVLKLVTVPLLIGGPILLSWPRAGFVVRGVVLLELVATAFRLGWLYLVSPVRLCSNYLLDDQQQLGRLLLLLGTIGVVTLAWKLIWGRVRVERFAG